MDGRTDGWMDDPWEQRVSKQKDYESGVVFILRKAIVLFQAQFQAWSCFSAGTEESG